MELEALSAPSTELHSSAFLVPHSSRISTRASRLLGRDAHVRISSLTNTEDEDKYQNGYENENGDFAAPSFRPPAAPNELNETRRYRRHEATEFTGRMTCWEKTTGRRGEAGGETDKRTTTGEKGERRGRRQDRARGRGGLKIYERGMRRARKGKELYVRARRYGANSGDSGGETQQRQTQDSGAQGGWNRDVCIGTTRILRGCSGSSRARDEHDEKDTGGRPGGLRMPNSRARRKESSGAERTIQIWHDGVRACAVVSAMI
ncbi:hypothetical protein B0H11DRAFT_1907614 [Mycena galericulata]|nr:hypothetical protein B0H11DRAFT_1907614 [Mycena galericulata]